MKQHCYKYFESILIRQLKKPLIKDLLKAMYMIIIVSSIFFLSTLLYSQTSIKYEFHNKSPNGQNELKAIVHKKKYSLIRKSDGLCIEKEKIADFDNDGFDDVLVKIEYDCGATSLANYQLYSFNGSRFVKSPVVGYDWNGINIDKSANKYLFEIDNTMEGVSIYELCNNSVEIYAVENHNLKLVNVIKEIYRPSIKEVKSSDFETIDNQLISMQYDIDSDSKTDNLIFEDLGSWGRMALRIEFGNGKVYEDDNYWKRVGILKSRTKGLNDLVVDCDIILKWNGNEYTD
jgi:hypothetical protein